MLVNFLLIMAVFMASCKNSKVSLNENRINALKQLEQQVASQLKKYTSALTMSSGETLSFDYHTYSHPNNNSKMVLVHGTRDHYLTHFELIDQLIAKNFDVVSVQLHDHGHNRDYMLLRNDFTLYRQQLNQILIETENRKTVNLFGHSLGGLTVVDYKQTYDLTVNAVVVAPALKFELKLHMICVIASFLPDFLINRKIIAFTDNYFIHSTADYDRQELRRRNFFSKEFVDNMPSFAWLHEFSGYIKKLKIHGQNNTRIIYSERDSVLDVSVYEKLRLANNIRLEKVDMDHGPSLENDNTTEVIHKKIFDSLT